MILVRNKILCKQHHFAIIDRFPYEDLERFSGGGGVLGVILFAGGPEAYFR